MTIKIPIFILFCLPFMTGCFQEPRPDGLPKLYPMSIKITQEGTPLTDASVGLISSDPELQRWPAGANTDANGIAKIFT
ncbi:MAG: hypothetical protein Q4G68_05580 [Planctomycetia bacterium]|nr:hypothetical protein [Planctomycetia bacterium]